MITPPKIPVYTNSRPVDWDLIPVYMHDEVRGYIERGSRPGDFLRAVLCNDLRMAVGYADNTNLRCLPKYVMFLYNYAPGDCWGSEAKVLAWIAKGGLHNPGDSNVGTDLQVSR